MVDGLCNYCDCKWVIPDWFRDIFGGRAGVGIIEV